MEIQGKIIAALPERSGTSARGEWKVQEFVLESLDGQYTRKMVFDVFGAERLQRFNIQVGQDVLVAFDIDAREYNGRWYNSIRAFDVRPVAAPVGVAFDSPAPAAQPQSVPVSQPVSAPAPAAADVLSEGGEGTDNLPF